MSDFNYKLILADGTEIENLGLNGNNYISKTEITESVFEDNLSTVTIEHPGDEPMILTDAVLDQLVLYEDGWYFVLSEKTEAQKLNDQLQALKDQNAMLEDCIIEMSEIIYQ